MVKVGAARAVASEWVREQAARHEDFRGAYFAGSTTWLPDDAELAPASDVDVAVVMAGDTPRPKLGKFRHRGVLIEVSYVPQDLVTSAEEVLSSYHLAGSFRVDTIIEDPTGSLRTLQATVARDFAEPAWVRRRYEDALDRLRAIVGALDLSEPVYDSVTRWLFSTGVTTHVLLVAALRNPTVRLRYRAARDVLVEYGQEDLYRDLLGLLGCADITPRQVQHHLDELAHTFDATAAVSRTEYFFSSDITPEARPIAIDGSQELIDRGDHREAVFWIVATFARCHKILAADGSPELRESLMPAFRAVVADLGITSTDDLTRRAGETLRFLPRLRASAEAILCANPAVRRP
ncbi:MAG: hypothetical protein WCA46_02250 [Actinocatenispora sp.]